MTKGWFLESTRHSMSAKGLSTGRKTKSKVNKQKWRTKKLTEEEFAKQWIKKADASAKKRGGYAYQKEKKQK